MSARLQSRINNIIAEYYKNISKKKKNNKWFETLLKMHGNNLLCSVTVLSELSYTDAKLHKEENMQFKNPGLFSLADVRCTAVWKIP